MDLGDQNFLTVGLLLEQVVPWHCFQLQCTLSSGLQLVHGREALALVTQNRHLYWNLWLINICTNFNITVIECGVFYFGREVPSLV